MTPEQARGLASILISSGGLRRESPVRTRHCIRATWSSPINDADYFHEKVDHIKSLFPTSAEPALVLRTPSGQPKTYAYLRFELSTSEIDPLYSLFMPRGIRRITSAALELCGAKAVTWLWSEHAHVTSSGVEIRSFAKTPEEYILVGQWMQILLGVQCVAYVKSAENKRLFIDHLSAAKAAEQLLDYCPETRRDLFLRILDAPFPVCVSSPLLRARRKRHHPAAWATPTSLDGPPKAGDRIHVS